MLKKSKRSILGICFLIFCSIVLFAGNAIGKKSPPPAEKPSVIQQQKPAPVIQPGSSERVKKNQQEAAPKVTITRTSTASSTPPSSRPTLSNFWIRPNPSSRTVRVQRKKDPVEQAMKKRWLAGYRPGTPEARDKLREWKIHGDSVPPRSESETYPTLSIPVVSHKDFGEVYKDEREATSQWYGTLRNQQAPLDPNGKPILQQRNSDLAVGKRYMDVPGDQLEKTDVVRLPVGSFSIKTNSPWGIKIWEQKIGNDPASHFSFGPFSYNYFLYKFHHDFQKDPQGAKDSLASRYPGLKFLQYIGNDTYIVRFDPRDETGLRKESLTRWLDRYRSEYKILPNVGRIPLSPDLANERVFELIAVLFAGEDLDSFSNAVRSLGGELVGYDRIPWPFEKDLYYYNVYFRLDKDQIRNLATYEGIHWIEEVAPKIPHNDVVPSQAQTASFGSVTTRPYWQLGIDGRTQIGADSGCCGTANLELDSPTFADDCTTAASSSGVLDCTKRKVIRYRGAATTSGGYSHASNTSANMLGNTATHSSSNPGGISGSASGCPRNNDGDLDGWPDFDGVARGSKLTHIDDSAGLTETAAMTSVYGDVCTVSGNTIGARVHNRSYSYSGTENTYGAASNDVDTFSFSNRDYLAFTSAGNNDGTAAPCDEIIPAPATAKNDVTVGVSGGLNANIYRYGFSGGSCNNIGPETATSGRVGPTLVNVGANNNTVGTYLSSEFCANTDSDMVAPISCNVSSGAEGTSFASPFTAGMGLLIRDYFEQGYYPTGTKVPANSVDVSAALVKAALIAGTDIMTSNQQGQTDRFRTGTTQRWGYGVPILSNILKIDGDSRTPAGMKVFDNQCVAVGTPLTFNVNVVKSTTKPLRIALVWTDPAGNALVNNLNLSVTHNGNTYLGNVFAGAYSTTGGTADTQNNMEAVFIDPANVATGNLAITVTAASVPTDDPVCPGTNNQQFALFISGDVVETSSISFNKNTYDCADSLTVTVKDVTAISAATVSSAVTITTSNGDSETIPAGNWTGSSCTGSDCNTWTATIPVNGNAVTTNNGALNVTHSATITGNYTDPHMGHSNQQTTASVNCQAAVLDGGYLIDGGCDEGTSPEKYVPYMDAGEVVAYTMGVYNNSTEDLTDARVTLSLSGPGASQVTILGSSTVVIGRIPALSVTGAVFNLQIGSPAPLTPVTLTGSVTSPADGFTTPVTISQAQLLETDDIITVQTDCRTHNAADMANRAWGGFANANWVQASGTACEGENRTDGPCDNATVAMYKQTTCGGTNVPANSAATLFPNAVITTINKGTGPTGQPWRYALKRHSVYGATAQEGNQSICTGLFYHDDFQSSTLPADGIDVLNFPWSLAWFFQTLWDNPADADTTWDWDADNSGTPDAIDPPDPFCGTSGTPPDNQLNICFPPTEVGNSTANSYILYGHVALDCDILTGGNTANNDGFGVDNNELLWEEFYAGNDGSNCSTTGQCGTVSFDKFSYGNYPDDTAVISVLDTNATSPLTVTVTATTGDSENVTLTGSAPYFSGTLVLSHNRGNGANNGVLYVLPTDILTATYNDSDNGLGSPCSDTNFALVNTPGGDVVYVSNAIDPANSNGDDDAWADTNERIALNITIKNNMTTALTNTRVRISTTDPDISCIFKDTASYGTVGAGASATNPGNDQFIFQVSSTTNTTDWQNPAKAIFTVYIFGDNFAGSKTVQQFQLELDLNACPGTPPDCGPSWTLTQNFNTDPGWVVTVGPGDDDADPACAGVTYVNDFHWCASCGNGNGGYGAWVGNNPFNTAGQVYRNFSDSTLYSPVLTADAANPAVTFQRAYGAEDNFDGAAVQYSINGGPWQYMTFTGMTVNMNPNTAYCNPLDSGVMDVWEGPSAVTWATSGTVAIPAAAGDTFQVRWRLGSDSVFQRAGYGVDDVTITNLRQTVQPDTTDNSALPGCSPAGNVPLLKVSKGSGNTVNIGFTNACNGYAHSLYWSKNSFPIDATDWNNSGKCDWKDPDSNADTMEQSWTTPSLNPGELLWFVVVGNSNSSVVSQTSLGEGSYGTNSAGAERPPIPSGYCAPQNLTACSQ